MNKQKFPSDEIYNFISGAQVMSDIDSVDIINAFPNLNPDTIFESLIELEDDKLIMRVAVGIRYKYITI
jgi:hypothetical protein